MSWFSSCWTSLKCLEGFHPYLKFAPVLLTAAGAALGTLLLVYVGDRIELLKSERERAEKEGLAEELASARGKLSELAAKQTPRQLTRDQMNVLTQRLRATPGMLYDVATVVGDSDGYQYALQFIEMLQAAAWKGRVVPNISHARPAPVGVRVVVRSRGRIPPVAQLLLDSLVDAGTPDVGGVVDSTATEDLVQIRIGFKSVPVQH